MHAHTRNHKAGASSREKCHCIVPLFTFLSTKEREIIELGLIRFEILVSAIRLSELSPV